MNRASRHLPVPLQGKFGDLYNGALQEVAAVWSAAEEAGQLQHRRPQQQEHPIPVSPSLAVSDPGAATPMSLAELGAIVKMLEATDPTLSRELNALGMEDKQVCGMNSVGMPFEESNEDQTSGGHEDRQNVSPLAFATRLVKLMSQTTCPLCVNSVPPVAWTGFPQSATQRAA